VNPIGSKRILICPLDWGLGHATRCVPIINEFNKRGCEVIVASSGEALILLKKEFPSLQFQKLVSYRVRYSLRLPFMIKVFLQIPKFIQAVWQERNEVAKIIKEEKIDLVISDCRYGCWSDIVPSIFITHQVNLLMPPLLRWIGPLTNFFNHLQITKFTRCWVPDFPKNRITGKLSEADGLNVKYIGMLSRFNSSVVTARSKKYEVLAVLSGPEPQRTKFEKILKSQLLLSGKPCLLVRGLPGENVKNEVHNQLVVVNYLSSNELQTAIEDSKVVISRSGYSSVMDFTRLGGRVIFVPTPGQTEQEYLAQQLEMKGIAFYQRQEKFDLNFALKQVERYKGFNSQNFQHGLLSEAIDDLLR
jgi:uncharacterized protein (TIGR00661 family)